ncbi:DUF5665 domain-containing protein [Crassaminicella indica]|uniref:Signal transduction histidine kinase n=1 Tax=Crassaminicella indica TaxID=2855394 RepID=A0ABX8R9X4_9CLOT|nr:DUF5665 domain-containing protein [Crassaminicella indica]QXM05849.1 hypothetical protein KVH43_10865 [Crassaminicella indica]
MDEERIGHLEKNIEKISKELERAKIGEYVDIMNNPKRLLYINFIGGLARGLGTAIGLTILAAVFFYSLQKTVDLPLIGRYIAELIDIIENYR